MGNKCMVSVQVNVDETKEETGIELNQKIIIPVTKEEVILLKISWSEIKKDWCDVCIMAFTRWFSTYPEIAKLFSKSKVNLTMDELLQTPAIQGHVSRFSDLIEKVLHQIGVHDRLIKTLIDYGKFHYAFGAEQKYATSLATSLKYAVCYTSNCDVPTQNAWDSLFRFIAGLLKLGIRKGKEEAMNSSAENHSKNINKDSINVVNMVAAKTGE